MKPTDIIKLIIYTSIIIEINSNSINAMKKNVSEKNKLKCEELKRKEKLDLNCNIKNNHLNIENTIGKYFDIAQDSYNNFIKNSIELENKYKNRFSFKDIKDKSKNSSIINNNDKDDTIYYNSLFNKDFQRKLISDFQRNLSSNDTIKSLKSQNSLLKNTEVTEYFSEINDFNQKERELSLEDKNSVKEGTKLYNSILNFSKNNIKEFNQSGILSPLGHIFNNSKGIHEFITNEALLSKEFFKKENLLNVDDIERLIHIKTIN